MKVKPMNVFLKKLNNSRIELIFLFFFLFVFLSVFNNVMHYGFWRQDCWAYSNDELHEFQFHGRWLAPVFYYFLHFLSPIIAWVLSVALLYYYFYSFLKRVYRDLDIDIFILLTIPFFFIVSPALVAQLNWPIHSLSAILVLALGAYLTRVNNSLFVMALTTMLSFAIFQSFSFFTILLAIPSISIMVKMTTKELLRKALLIVIVWFGSLLVAYILSKGLQYIYFGEFPPLAKWRRPNPASNIFELLANIWQNIKLMNTHLNQYFFSYTNTLFVLLFVASCFFDFCKKKTSHIKVVFFYIAIVLLIAFSIYLITAPLGVIIDLRSIYNIGAAFLMLYVGLSILIIYSKNTKLLHIILLSIFTFIMLKPCTISYHNTLWFRTITQDIKSGVEELQQQGIRSIDKIVIDHRGKKGPKMWMLDYSASLKGQPLFMESVIWPYKLKRVFTELGYRKRIIWCDGVKKIKECENLNRVVFDKCSFVNPNLCTSTKSKSIWYLKF